ncbi:hypothetical protein [Acutalibacter intestini]|uniref:hypothetical protein n=1 Tax=Acutalibacter intestini TaxID=3093659 RepID=UPI002AC8BE19|nr:hypothetical protein [Acutalibacter sp. M00204]
MFEIETSKTPTFCPEEAIFRVKNPHSLYVSISPKRAFAPCGKIPFVLYLCGKEFSSVMSKGQPYGLVLFGKGT